MRGTLFLLCCLLLPAAPLRAGEGPEVLAAEFEDPGSAAGASPDGILIPGVPAADPAAELAPRGSADIWLAYRPRPQRRAPRLPASPDGIAIPGIPDADEENASLKSLQPKYLPDAPDFFRAPPSGGAVPGRVLPAEPERQRLVNLLAC